MLKDAKGGGRSKAADAPRGKSGVQSLARAFSILEEIGRAQEGIGLADLSKIVDLHTSTTFHLVKTLVQLGYLRQDLDTKRYFVGSRLFYLAGAALDDVALTNTAEPILEELANATGETSHFAVRSGQRIIIIARIEGGGAFRFSEGIGVERPGHATAVGKMILATMEPDQLDRYLAENPLESYTPATITDPDRLREELKSVREAGLAFDDAEHHTEVRCAAVPVYDFRGGLAGALGISGPVWRLSLSVLQTKVPLLRSMADRLSAALGYRAPAPADAAPQGPRLIGRRGYCAGGRQTSPRAGDPCRDRHSRTAPWRR